MKVMELENDNSQGRSIILVNIFRTDDAAPLFLVLTEYLSWRDLGNLEIAQNLELGIGRALKS